MTAATSGLDRESLAMRLWRSAARHAWTSEQVDFGADRRQWLRLSSRHQQRLACVCALFHVGEKAVTRHLLPLVQVVASEGRLEEELYLASFLFDEAKHVDLFDRFFAEVVKDESDPDRHAYRRYQRVVEEELDAALSRLSGDPSPEAQVRAVATYTIVVEGIMAETGAYVLRRMLAADCPLPGMARAMALLARDESRHVAFGVHLLTRLIVEHGDPAYRAFLRRMTELKPLVEASTEEFVDLIGSGDDFHVTRDELFRYSQRRFTRRVQKIVKARVDAVSSSPASLTGRAPASMGDALR